jgi:hypothetical protein
MTLGAEPSYAPVSEARGRVAVAPVVLPDSTTRAKLNLARYRSGRTSRLEPADALSDARRRLAAARARHR